ncbi:hypothetical protein ACF0H5_022412 [Mactra antiquata]
MYMNRTVQEKITLSTNMTRKYIFEHSRSDINLLTIHVSIWQRMHKLNKKITYKSPHFEGDYCKKEYIQGRSLQSKLKIALRVTSLCSMGNFIKGGNYKR